MSTLTPFDLHLFREGTHQRLYELFGAHLREEGTRFTAWIPGANSVWVSGDFNGWSAEAHPMEQTSGPDIWETFIPGVRAGALYRYRVDCGTRRYEVRDLFAFCDHPKVPDAAVVCDTEHNWHDRAWMQHHRRFANSLEAPVAICAGAVQDAKELGFTHVLVPGMNGFAPEGLSPRELIALIEELHHQGVGAVSELKGHAWGEGREAQAVAASAAVYAAERYHIDLLIGRDLVRDDGWARDLIRYLAIDPLYRKGEHGLLTARSQWAFEHNFVLPLPSAETEVWGDYPQLAATRRLVLALQYASPGKKLVRPSYEPGVPLLTGQLNHLYRSRPALHQTDHAHEGFEWIVADDAEHNIVAFVRRDNTGGDLVLFVANFSPVVRTNYRVGVPARGFWREVLNTDAPEYGGAAHGNFGGVEASPVPLHGQRYSVTLTVPPLAGVFFHLGR
jgi:1,4-alpha-glucan branching enzyme